MTDAPSDLDLLASATTLLAALEVREVSARELLAAHVERIERLDGEINAVCTLSLDRAVEEAGAIDDARVRGGAMGPLAGLPVTVKDAIATEGIRSTGGATELRDHVPERDATVVRSIRDAGAVVFGKTNLPRWSGDFQSYNEIFGTTSNPWDLERTPGGSSGGAAAAVAMGFSPFEIGSDIGGSIRVPSSFCGIHGHKPSFGAVPTHGYLDHPSHHRSTADVNVFGPMARSLEDLELLLGLLAGPNDHDAAGWRLDLPQPRAVELSDFRVAAWLDDDFCPVGSDVRAVMDAAVSSLEAGGARIDHEARPALDPREAALCGMRIIGAAADISDAATRHEPGAQYGHIDLELLRRDRDGYRLAWSEFFSDVDVLLCPVMPVPPFQHVQAAEGSNFAHSVLADHDDRPYADLLWWCGLIGSAYLPVTSTPIGRTANGLPVGVQIVAPFLHDRTSMAFARAIEPVLGGYQPPPLARA